MSFRHTLQYVLNATLLAANCCAAASFAQRLSEPYGDEVVVTATRFAERDIDRPVNVMVISADDIRNSAAKTLPDLLSERAGITVHDLFGNNAASATVDLRGFGATGGQNTVILVDGRRLGDIDLSGLQWSAIPFAAIERIEIVRGGGAVLYGDGASGGVINIITRQPLAGPPSGSVQARGGSYGTREGQLSANYQADRFGINLTASNFESDGYRDNNHNRQTNAIANLRWVGNDSDIIFRAGTDHQGLRLPGARMVQPSAGIDLLATDRRGAATPFDYAQRNGNHASFDWQERTRFGELVVGGGYRDKVQTSYFDFGGFPDFRNIELEVWSFTPRLRMEQPWFGRDNSLVIGYDWYRWNYDLRKSSSPAAINQPVNTVSATQENSAIYLYDTLRLSPSTTLAAGYRRERFRLSASDQFDPTAPGGAFGSGAAPDSQSEWVHAYELGLRHRWSPQLALTAKVGRSYRFANVDETYETTPFFTPEFQFLRPQINHSTELSADFDGAGVGMRATLFNIDVTDEVHLDAYSSGIGNTNLPPSRRRGFELDARWSPSTALAFTAAYTYTDARFESGVLPGSAFTATNVVIAGKRVPLVPKQKLNLGAVWRLSTNARLGAAFSYVGEQFMDNDEGNTLGVQIPAYSVTDLKFIYEMKHWRLSAAVNNIFDRKYYNYAVRSQFVVDRYNAYPLPERHASAAVEYSF